MMGRFAGFAGLLALVGCAAIGAASAPKLPSPPGVVPVAVTTAALSLNSEDMSVRSVGALAYRGGLVIQSASPIFGGISGLRVLPDGLMLGITDRGDWILFQTIETSGRLLDIDHVEMAPLLGSDGKPLPADDRDSESVELTPLGDGTDLSVSLEHNHRILHFKWPKITSVEQMFTDSAGRADADFSSWMHGMPDNGGVEAHAVMAFADGSTAEIAISEERLHANGGHDARLDMTHPDSKRLFGFATDDDFKPTDAHWLPGRHNRKQLLVLYRAFSPLRGVRAKLKFYDLTDVKPGALVEGETLMRLMPPLLVDNMEGLAVIARGNSYDIYLVSDDNFNSLQRTLLMKFAWTPSPSQQ
jgi:hypothetical protein